MSTSEHELVHGASSQASMVILRWCDFPCKDVAETYDKASKSGDSKLPRVSVMKGD